jgi:hypothetical protein
MKDRSPEKIYQQQIEKHKETLNGLLKKKDLFGWLRLLVFLATVIISFKIFAASGAIGLLPALVGFALFLYLVFIDTDNNEKIEHTKTLININEEELKILNNNFSHRPTGIEYLPHVHDYAHDLDLFGTASLFQLLNRCSSEQGQYLLANNLLHPLTQDQIVKRQEAVAELSPDVEWRQQFQSFSHLTVITTSTETKIVNWLSEEEKHFKSPSWKVLVWLYTIITLFSAAAAIAGFIPSGTFLFLFTVYFIISIILSRNTLKPYVQLSKIVREISTVEKLVNWIENKKLASPLLVQMQQNLAAENGNASAQIRKLKSILDKFDLRLNIVGPLFMNSFLLWDVRQMMALNEWRRKNKPIVPRLFQTIAEMEVVNSVAAVHFNYPHWSFPKFADTYFFFESRELGHPLIPEKERVNNDFRVEKDTLISLVTGSNMAGKSTFLRSIGVNIVLAQMGSPVCAQNFILSPVRLMTSMRISDNLAENTSTFYAELKKLKTIIEAVNRHEKIFVLLDEILRGTNSHDRHTGSAAFITQLIRQRTFAVIATHDLELADMEKQYPQAFGNYHFDVQVKNEELFFDYKLKEGVCQSLNASLLMKKIGIEL